VLEHVLVTGGAGLVGSHVVEALLAAGCAVRILDNLLPAAHDGAPDVPDGAALRIADVRDPAAVDDALAGVDAVSHQAGMVGLGTSFDDVADYVDHNDLGTAVLLRALARRRFRGRLVLASSMVVYGEGRYRCPRHGVVAPGPRRPEDLDAGRFEPPCPSCGEPLAPGTVDEDARPDPRNIYAATKLHQEHLAQAFSRETGVPVTALRYHNVYGPRMPRDSPYAGVASLFRSAIAAGQAPRIFEDGRQRRDFVHVRDVAHANVAALTMPDPVPGAFNIASGEPHTVGEMAQALWRAAGRTGPPPVVTGEYRLGDVRHIVASTDRAARELGFRAETGFAGGMAEFAAAQLRAPSALDGMRDRLVDCDAPRDRVAVAARVDPARDPER
jgi:dTDP-L-rhamnose 4-epimerase